MSLLPPAVCLLLISFVLPKGLALVAKTSTTSLTRWRIDEHGVSCVDRGARYAWSWGSIKGFSIGPHPAVETVAVVNVDFRGEGRQPMYFDPIEIDPAELMERFGSIGKPAEPFWKRIGLGRRRSDDGETPQLQENDGKR